MAVEPNVGINRRKRNCAAISIVLGGRTIRYGLELSDLSRLGAARAREGCVNASFVAPRTRARYGCVGVSSDRAFPTYLPYPLRSLITADNASNLTRRFSQTALPFRSRSVSVPSLKSKSFGGSLIVNGSIFVDGRLAP